MNSKRSLSNLSYATTSVAGLGPWFVTLIVYFTRSPTYATVTLTVFVMFRLTIGLAVTLVPFPTSVWFSADFANAMFSNVPLVRTRTIKSTDAVVPLFNLGIIQVILLPVRVQLPVALTNMNSGTSSSVTSIHVALEGPLFVTLIVNLTRSVTFIAPVAFEYLTTTSFVTGRPVTFLELPLLSSGSVSFSWLVTLTAFGIFPASHTSAMM